MIPVDFTEYDEIPEPSTLVTIDNDFVSFFDSRLQYGKTTVTPKIGTIFYLKSYYAEKWHKEVITEKFSDPNWYGANIMPFVCDKRCYVTSNIYVKKQKPIVIDPGYDFI